MQGCVFISYTCITRDHVNFGVAEPALMCARKCPLLNYDLHMCELVFCQGVSWALSRRNLVALNNSCGQRLPVLGPKILCASWFQPHSSLWICTCTWPVDIFLQALLLSLANALIFTGMINHSEENPMSHFLSVSLSETSP